MSSRRDDGGVPADPDRVELPLTRDERIHAAQLSGVTRAHTQIRRLTREEALGEMTDILAGLAPDRRAAVLAHTAAAFVQTGYRDDTDRQGAELLEAAGADLAEARAVWLRRFPSGSPPPSWSI